MVGAQPPAETHWNQQYPAPPKVKLRKDPKAKMKRKSKVAAKTYGPPRPVGSVGYKMEGYGTEIPLRMKINRGVSNY